MQVQADDTMAEEDEEEMPRRPGRRTRQATPRLKPKQKQPQPKLTAMKCMRFDLLLQNVDGEDTKKAVEMAVKAVAYGMIKTAEGCFVLPASWGYQKQPWAQDSIHLAFGVVVPPVRPIAPTSAETIATRIKACLAETTATLSCLPILSLSSYRQTECQVDLEAL